MRTHLRRWSRSLLPTRSRPTSEDYSIPEEKKLNPKALPDEEASHRHRESILAESKVYSSRRQSRLLGRRRVHVLVLGPAGVGKRSFYNKLVYGTMVGGEAYGDPFSDPRYPSFNHGGYRYEVDMRSSVSTPAEVRNECMDAHNQCGIILTYDLSSVESWHEAVRLQTIISGSSQHDVEIDESNNRRIPHVQTMLLGLKADIHGNGWPPRRERERFAEEHGALFAECSSLMGMGVREAMEAFLRRAHERIGNDRNGVDMDTQVREAFDNAVCAVQEAYSGR